MHMHPKWHNCIHSHKLLSKNVKDFLLRKGFRIIAELTCVHAQVNSNVRLSNHHRAHLCTCTSEFQCYDFEILTVTSVRTHSWHKTYLPCAASQECLIYKLAWCVRCSVAMRAKHIGNGLDQQRDIIDSMSHIMLSKSLAPHCASFI